jgi:hypothetical protein
MKITLRRNGEITEIELSEDDDLEIEWGERRIAITGMGSLGEWNREGEWKRL